MASEAEEPCDRSRESLEYTGDLRRNRPSRQGKSQNTQEIYAGVGVRGRGNHRIHRRFAYKYAIPLLSKRGNPSNTQVIYVWNGIRSGGTWRVEGGGWNGKSKRWAGQP